MNFFQIKKRNPYQANIQFFEALNKLGIFDPVVSGDTLFQVIFQRYLSFNIFYWKKSLSIFTKQNKNIFPKFRKRLQFLSLFGFVYLKWKTKYESCLLQNENITGSKVFEFSILTPVFLLSCIMSFWKSSMANTTWGMTLVSFNTLFLCAWLSDFPLRLFWCSYRKNKRINRKFDKC